MKLQIRLLSRPRDHTTNASVSSGYAVFTPPAGSPGQSSGDGGIVYSQGAPAKISLQDAIKISYCFAAATTRKNKSFRPIAVEFADFQEVSLLLSAREMWASPSFQPNETVGYLLL